MDNRRICSVSGNRGKARLYEVRLFGTEAQQLFGNIPFGNAAIGMIFYPFEDFNHRDAVFEECIPVIFNFGFVLHRFHRRGDIKAFYDIRFNLVA